MKHDLVKDPSIYYEDPHDVWIKCRRCGEAYWNCCWYKADEEECPSNQLELLDTNLSVMV